MKWWHASYFHFTIQWLIWEVSLCPLLTGSHYMNNVIVMSVSLPFSEKPSLMSICMVHFVLLLMDKIIGWPFMLGCSFSRANCTDKWATWVCYILYVLCCNLIHWANLIFPCTVPTKSQGCSHWIFHPNILRVASCTVCFYLLITLMCQWKYDYITPQCKCLCYENVCYRNESCRIEQENEVWSSVLMTHSPLLGRSSSGPDSDSPESTGGPVARRP